MTAAKFAELGDRNTTVAAERVVLGNALLVPDDLPTLAEVLSPDDFALAAHRHVFAAMLGMSARGDALDIVTLAEELRRAGKLTEAGGLEYLGVIAADVSAGNVVKHANIVKDASTLRAVAAAGAEVTQLARGEGTSADDALDRAQAVMLRLVDRRSADTMSRAGEVLRSPVFPELQRRFEHRQAHGTAPIGLATGFERVDAMTGGLHGGDLIVVAGRPSMGKTAWCMNVAANVAVRSRKPAVVFSLEMGKEALVLRHLASEARVSHERLRDGDLGERDWPKLAKACEAIDKAPLYIDDSGVTSVLDIRARCRRLKASEGALGVVVVDYLQLMKGAGYSGGSREQEVSGFSRGLKNLARELGCPIIALSQLSRALESRSDKRPMMSDLRESGAIEQDADVIGFLYRDEYYNKASSDEGIAEFIIGKQRNGPTGTARLKFNGALVRFDDLDEDRR